jgi:hypothetical protein
MQNTTAVRLRIFFFLLVCVAPVLRSQSVTVIARIADADIINAGSLFDPMADRVKDLAASTFSLTFVNATVPRQDVHALLHIETYTTLDEDRVRMPLATLDSRQPFLIPKEGRVFTSRDTRGVGDMQFSTVNNDPNIQKVKDKVWDPASGGRMPSGKYEILITVTVVQVGTQTVHEQVPVPIAPVLVSNPTVAALIVPSENGYHYPTVFPQFQWTYDTRSIMLSVYEMRADQQSLEDATQASDPYLQVHIDRRVSGNVSLFTYPQIAAAGPGIEILKGPRPLDQGKTYVVVLEGLRAAFGAPVDPLRTIRSFTIDDPRSRAAMLSYRTLFAGPEYQDILDRLQNGNYQIDANGITLNNSAISLQQLQSFLSQNRGRKFSIHIEE